MRRTLAIALFFFAAIGLSTVWAGGRPEDPEEVKEGLQELNDYIGQWRGSGTIPDNKFLIWRENADWSWRFKGKDAWLTMTVPDGKYMKNAEVRYYPSKDEYQLTILEKEGKRVFKGEARGSKLTFERKDPKTNEKQQVKMLIAGGGLRFIYEYAVRKPNRSFFSKKFQVAYTKKGVTFGAKKKDRECVVTGGLGTIKVSYGGRTYWVCCTGCRDVFNEDPAKILAEYKKKKRK